MLFTSRLNHARRTFFQTLSSQHTKKPLSSISQNHNVSQTLPNLKPLNSKLSDLFRRGLIEDARKLFDETPHRNTVTWNAMIRGFFLNGLSDIALNMFDEMPQRDSVSYNTVIAGLMSLGDVEGARRVFERVKIRDVVTWNSMVSGYIRNGMIEKGISVFEEMPVKDVISWNLVINGLVKSGEIDLAGKYFGRMDSRDVVSWTLMISGLTSVGRVVEARELFDEMPFRDSQAWNAMLLGYIENRAVEKAEALFHKMPIFSRDFDSWNSLVEGLVRFRRFKDALRLFREMPEKCRRTWNLIVSEWLRDGPVREIHGFLEKFPYNDVVSWTTVIVGYFEIGDVNNAVRLFEMLTIRDRTVYNATIFGLGQNDRGEKGIKIFLGMRETSLSPDEATFTSLLAICSDLAAEHLGLQTHSLTVKSGFADDIKVCNATITMYAKCGNLDSAFLQFSSMPSHDIISWNSIICGFANHGKAQKALEMFDLMRSENFKPDQITFVGILSACSNAGLVDQGGHFFGLMRDEFFLRPTSEHYTCLVDLLGKFGPINEAVSLLGQMRSEGIEIRASLWGALLGACRIHNNIEVAEIATERVLEIEPWNSGVYLILAEMYITCGRRKEAQAVWTRMKNSGVKKQPGCSWIELNNNSHVFLSGDRSNSELCKVSSVLELLHSDIKSVNTRNL